MRHLQILTFLVVPRVVFRVLGLASPSRLTYGQLLLVKRVIVSQQVVWGLILHESMMEQLDDLH